MTAFTTRRTSWFSLSHWYPPGPEVFLAIPPAYKFPSHPSNLSELSTLFQLFFKAHIMILLPHLHILQPSHPFQTSIMIPTTPPKVSSHTHSTEEPLSQTHTPETIALARHNLSRPYLSPWDPGGTRSAPRPLSHGCVSWLPCKCPIPKVSHPNSSPLLF